MRIQDAIQFALSQLQHQEAPLLEAEILLAHTLGKSRSHLKAWPEAEINASQQNTLAALVKRRSVGEPIAYIVGKREFWDIELQVTPATLIPRPETEHLVELALQLIPTDTRWQIADLGTGSGAIALAIAKHRPMTKIIATDFSHEALAVARENAAQLGLTNVEFQHSHWLQELGDQRFNLIVSNPPYVADDDPHLQQGDLRFEPHTALRAGLKGLDDIRQIINSAPDYLKTGGSLMLEHGYDQGKAVEQLLKTRGFSDVFCHADFAQRERVSEGKYSS